MKLSNPAIAAAASNPDILKAGERIIISTQEKAVSTVKTVIGIVSVGVVGWYANKKFKEWRKQNFVTANAHLPDVQAAMIMRKAMFKVEFSSFPFNLVSIPDGTNEAMLNSLAAKVSSLANVIKAYKILFEANLILDVYDELNDKELQKFYENLGSKGDYDSQFGAGGIIKPQTPFKIGQEIQIKNPNGSTVFEAKELSNGKFQGTNVKRNFVKFSTIVGEIIGVYKGVSGQYYYVVDMDDYKYGPDFIYGHGWIAHTEVKLI